MCEREREADRERDKVKDRQAERDRESKRQTESKRERGRESEIDMIIIISRRRGTTDHIAAKDIYNM